MKDMIQCLAKSKCPVNSSSLCGVVVTCSKYLISSLWVNEIAFYSEDRCAAVACQVHKVLPAIDETDANSNYLTLLWTPGIYFLKSP